MAISTPTALDSVASVTNSTTIVSNTVAPSANALLVVCALATGASGTGPLIEPTISDTLSGGSLSWTRYGGVENSGSVIASAAIFVAQCGATPGTGTITITWAANTPRKVLHVVQVASGYNTSAPVKQSKTGTGTTDTTITLDATPDTDSLVIGTIVGRSASPDNAPGTGWTELAETLASTNTAGQVQYDEASAPAACSWTHSSTAAGVVVEIDAAAAGGTDTPKSVDGTLTTAGAASKDTGKANAGTLTTAGALTTTRQFLLSVAGTLSTAGTIARDIAKSVAGALTPAGSSSGSRPISTPTVLTTKTNGSGATSLTTDSFSPAANALLIVTAPWSSGNGSTQTPMGISDTLSGGSLTWTKLEVAHYDTGDSAFCGVFYAVTGATPGSGTVTVTCQASASRRTIQVVQIAGGYNPTTPVKQSKTGTSASTTPSITLDATPDSDSMVLGVIGTRNGITAVTPGAGWTELVDTSAGTDHTAQVQYDATAASATIAWSATGTLNAMIGLEIDALVTGTNYPSSVAGVLSFLGTLVTSRTYLTSLAGSLPMSGTVSRSIAKGVAGAVTTAGATAKAVFRAVAGTLGSSGGITTLKAIGQVVGGTLSFAGGISKRTLRAIAGILSFLGSLVTFVPGADAVDVTLTDAARTTVTLADNVVSTVTLSDTSRSTDD